MSEPVGLRPIRVRTRGPPPCQDGPPAAGRTVAEEKSASLSGSPCGTPERLIQYGQHRAPVKPLSPVLRGRKGGNPVMGVKAQVYDNIATEEAPYPQRAGEGFFYA